MIKSLLFILLFLPLISMADDIKPCESYCCRHIKYFVVKDITEKGLTTTRHGADCLILCGTKQCKIRAVIKENLNNTDEICWFCNGEQMNYDRVCANLCCRHYKYVVDFSTGLIHNLNCKAIEKMPIYDALFKSKNYNLINGYKEYDYTGLCLFCLSSVARLN